MSNAAKRNRAQKAVSTTATAPTATTTEPTPATPAAASRDLLNAPMIPAQRYVDAKVPTEAAVKLTRADAIKAAKKRADWSKAEAQFVRKADQIAAGLLALGINVERPTVERHGVAVRKGDGTKGTAKVIDRNAPEVQAALAAYEEFNAIPRGKRTAEQQKAWAAGYRILLAERKADPSYTPRNKGGAAKDAPTSARVWTPRDEVTNDKAVARIVYLDALRYSDVDAKAFVKEINAAREADRAVLVLRIVEQDGKRVVVDMPPLVKKVADEPAPAEAEVVAEATADAPAADAAA